MVREAEEWRARDSCVGATALFMYVAMAGVHFLNLGVTTCRQL